MNNDRLRRNDVLAGAARNSILGFVAATALLYAPYPRDHVDLIAVSNAAVNPPATTIFSPSRALGSGATASSASVAPSTIATASARSSSTTTTTKIAPTPPLAVERTVLERARSRYADLQGPLRDARAAASSSSSSYRASVDAVKSARGMAVDARRRLLVANEEVTSARGKGKSASIVDAYVADATGLRMASNAADATLLRAKDAERANKSDLESKEKAVSGLTKSVDDARRAVDDAERKFDNAKKRLKESQEKAKKEERAAKERAAEKARKEKKKADEA